MYSSSEELLSKRKRSKRSPSPEISKRSKNISDQRSGKWSTEEECFANQLVKDFELGILDDCEEGCTLRSYLARRLNCAPMRISKKFAGRCIGKLAYVKCDEIFAPEKLKSPLQGLERIYMNSCSKIQRDSDYELSYSEDSSDENSGDSEADDQSADCYRSNMRSYRSTSSFSDDMTLGFYGLDDTAVFPKASSFSTEADDWKDVLAYFCGDDICIKDQKRDLERCLSSSVMLVSLN
jgi:hypothetical protein